MDIGITEGKIIVTLLTLIGCGWLLYRNRVAASKLVFGLGLTLFAIISLGVRPAEKRLERVEAELAILPKHDPGYGALEQTVLNSRKNLADIQTNPARRAEKYSPVTLGLDMLGGTEIRLRLSIDPAQYQRLQVELEALQNSRAALDAGASAEARKALDDQIEAKRAEVASEQETLAGDLTNAIDIIRQRLNNSGLAEIPVTKQGEDRVLIQLPGMEPEEADIIIETIEKQGRLEFRIVSDESDTEGGALLQLVRRQQWDEDVLNLCLLDGEIYRAEAHEVNEHGRLARPGQEGPGPRVYDWLAAPTQYNTITGERRAPSFHLVAKEVELTGHYVTQANFEPDVQRSGYRITLAFNSEGAARFADITRRFLKRDLAIVLDGKLQSAPTLQTVITGGRAEITGSFTQAEAKKLAVVLKSGSLRAKIEEEYRNKVGATLGEDSIRSGVQALLLGFAGVVLFMLIYYMAAGAISDVVLLINIIFIIASLAGLNATMTLPGLAGLVLTLGMNVDANVLIFERIREEREKGNPLVRAVHLGYSRAFVTIVDANLTTLITAIILHSFGTETVKGFAMTLMIGILTGMFCSIVMTRWALDFLIERKWIKELRMMKLFGRPNFDFLGKRRIVFTLSGVLIVLGMSLFLARGKQNLGQDLTGGVLVQVNTAKSYTMTEARQLADAHLGEKFPDARDSLQSQQSIDAPVKLVDGQRQYTTFTLRTKLVETNEEELKRQLAENPNVRLYSEAEFREAIDQAFELVPQGLVVDRQALPEQAPAGETAYRTNLNLRSPVAPRDLGVALVDHRGIMPLWIAGPDDTLPEVNGTDIQITARVAEGTGEDAAREAVKKAIESLKADWYDPARVLAVRFGAVEEGQAAVEVNFTAARPVAQTELDTLLAAQPEAVPGWTSPKWTVVPSVTSVEALVSRNFLPRDPETGAEYTEATALAALIEQLRPLHGGLFAADAQPLWTRVKPLDRTPGWRAQVVLPLVGHTTQAEMDAALAGREGAVWRSTEIRRMALYAHPETANEPVAAAQVLVSLPLRDEIGQLRAENMLYKSVRELFQGLQQRREVDFTDPMPRFTSVGASVADEMAANSLLAILFSLVAIFAYIWLRFQFRVGFSLAAVAGLVHDVLITLGALAFVDQFEIMNGQIDLTVVAALLTVVGYSLNNTIVVFDRIREHLHDSNKPVGDLVNRAVNETLSRTVITAGTTLWVVLMLLVLGGDVIRGFAFTLMVGIGAGTYSSMFLVGPLLPIFAKIAADREKRKLLVASTRTGRSAPAGSSGK